MPSTVSVNVSVVFLFWLLFRWHLIQSVTSFYAWKNIDSNLLKNGLHQNFWVIWIASMYRLVGLGTRTQPAATVINFPVGSEVLSAVHRK